MIGDEERKEDEGVVKPLPRGNMPPRKKTTRIPDQIRFFTTIKEDLDAIDINEMLDDISCKYPLMAKFEDTQLSASRLVMLDFLKDEDFIDYLMYRYDMNFKELLSCIYPSYGQLLSSVPFIRKVRKIVLSASYLED